jgi:hypothetical protein
VAEPWIPGASPADEFVRRLYRQIKRFADERGVPQAVVRVRLRDGSQYDAGTILAEPGYGFVTICPAAGSKRGDAADQVIVPLTVVERIEILDAAEEPGRFGFTIPDGEA